MVKWTGWGAALTTVTLFSLVPGLTKLVVQAGFAPLQLLSIRLMASLVLLGLHLLITRTSLRLERRALLAAIGVGLVSAAGELALFKSLVYVDAAVVTMFLAAIPIVVLVLLAWRGQKMGAIQWLRVGFGLAGVYILIGVPADIAAGLGILLAVVAVLLFGLQYALTQWYLADQPAVPVTFYGVLAAAGPVVLVYGLQSDVSLPEASVSIWLAIAVLAVGATYFARLSFLVAVRYLGSAELALLLPMEMFAGVLWALWLVGEQLTAQQWVGGGLTMLSAVIGVYAAGTVERRTALQPVEVENG